MKNNFKLKEQIIKDFRHGDHLVWFGICSRCGTKRYLFYDEMIRKGLDPHDCFEKRVACRNSICDNEVRIRSRIGDFRAVHLNNIRRRGEV